MLHARQVRPAEEPLLAVNDTGVEIAGLLAAGFNADVVVMSLVLHSAHSNNSGRGSENTLATNFEELLTLLSTLFDLAATASRFVTHASSVVMVPLSSSFASSRLVNVQV